MPGITGYVSQDSAAPLSSTVASMVASMHHGTHWASGRVVFAPAGAAAGWVAHRGSFADCMPVWNESHDICLVFSGEHLSDGQDFARICPAGSALATTDARWLVRWYEQSGPEFLQSLNGGFCGFLADLRPGRIRLLLFTDRYGLGRLYCHEDETGFYFASEAKALLRIRPGLRALDPAGLGEFLACGCTLQNRSLFAGIQLLPAGAVWTWQPPEPVSRRLYFERARWENQPPLAPEEFFERFRDTFSRVVPRYASGRQPVAMSVTGGVDSRMIMAALRTPPGSLPCYTFGGLLRESADVTIGRQVAQVCGQSHQVIPVTSRFFAEFPELAAQSVTLTDGTMDVTGAVGLFLNRLAREIAPVRLTGNYGGEILRGISSLKFDPIAEDLFDPGFCPHLRRVEETLAAERAGTRASLIAFKEVPWHHYSRLALESSQLTIRSPFLDNELVGLAFQAPPGPTRDKALAYRLIAAGNPALAHRPTDRGAARRPTLMPRAAWNWWKEFLPRAEYVYDYGMPPWFARIDRVLGPLHLEKLFLGRQKFAHFRLWYRRELAAYVRQVLLDRAALSRPYLNGRRVEAVVTAHLAGRGNYTREIHKLLTLELVQRHLLS